jgi:hypothetical protein
MPEKAVTRHVSTATTRSGLAPTTTIIAGCSPSLSPGDEPLEVRRRAYLRRACAISSVPPAQADAGKDR